jgi:hypothetical protein
LSAPILEKSTFALGEIAPLSVNGKVIYSKVKEGSREEKLAPFTIAKLVD